MTKAVSNFITGLVVHFGEPKFDVPDYDKPKAHSEWLKTMVHNFRNYSDNTLERAVQIIVSTRKYRSFPLVSECREACADADDWLKSQRLPMPDTSKPVPSAWSPDRITLADELVMGALGKQAARDGWVMALHTFCRDNLRLPAGPEIAKCIKTAKEFDEAYEWSLRGKTGPFSKSLVALGDSMLARREELRSMVLDGVLRQ